MSNKKNQKGKRRDMLIGEDEQQKMSAEAWKHTSTTTAKTVSEQHPQVQTLSFASLLSQTKTTPSTSSTLSASTSQPSQSAWGRGATPSATPKPSTSALSTSVSSIPDRVRGRGRGILPTPTNLPKSVNVVDFKEIVSNDEKTADSTKQIVEKVYNKKPQIFIDQTRSKQGHAGKPVKLLSNYFKLLPPTTSWHQYRVDFAPDVEIKSVRFGLLRVHKELFTPYTFDGTVLMCAKKLNKNLIDLFSNLRENEEPIKITLKFVGLLTSAESSSLQFYNLLTRQSLAGLKLQLVGRDYYDCNAKIQIKDHHLELWPGYITSVRQHESNILMCAEVTHKVMRTDTVYEIYRRCQQTRNPQTTFKKEVLGLTVLTDYNNKLYRIDDVDCLKNAGSTFPTKNGDITFIQYYKVKYNIHIKDKSQPLLISNPKARDVRDGRCELIALIPELCRVTGFSDDMRKNFHLMRDLAVHTRVNPGLRIQKLLDFNKRIYTTPESIKRFNDWNVKLEKNLVEVTGCELDKETIFFGNNKRVKADDHADWTSQIRFNKLYSTIKLKRWWVIAPSTLMNDARSFIKSIGDTSKSLGIDISDPIIQSLADDRLTNYLSAINDILNQDPQLIMCIVPNNRADRYSVIKKKCCVERAIPTQVICARTISNPRGLMSVATKVAIQMNCKLGAAPWMVGIPLPGLMTIGFDVCHDTQDKSKSYGAMVATMDLQKAPTYFSAVTAHKNGEELSNSFSLNIVKALNQYRQEHGTLPSRILIYRDGVGEGQINYVYEHEVNLIKERLEKIYLHANIKEGLRLAFVVVSKRINTRLFNNGKNPAPGTVVDDVITLPERYDFFLVSQSVGQGSASPTMYNIIHDNMGLPPAKMQILTYKMCHLYYNWSGTTRVPAMCQYAHKLATLVGQYLHQDPSNLLEKQLYFL